MTTGPGLLHHRQQLFCACSGAARLRGRWTPLRLAGVASLALLVGLFQATALATVAAAASAVTTAPKLAPKQPATVVPGAVPMVAAPADVIVKSIRIVPVQPKAGDSFEIHVELFNKGKGSTGPGQQYSLGIEPLAGWDSGPHPLEGVIAPNKSMVIIRKLVISSAGNYRVLARPAPGPDTPEIKQFVVAPKPVVKSAPVVSPRTVPVAPPPPQRTLKPVESKPQPLERTLATPAAGVRSAPPPSVPLSGTMEAYSFDKMAKLGYVAAFKIPDTRLWVEKPGLDGQQDWKFSWQDSIPVALKFRWKTVADRGTRRAAGKSR